MRPRSARASTTQVCLDVVLTWAAIDTYAGPVPAKPTALDGRTRVVSSLRRMADTIMGGKKESLERVLRTLRECRGTVAVRVLAEEEI